MQIKIIIGTVAFMLTMILLGFYTLLEPARMENFTDARLGRQIEAGASLYFANCATCHGVEGKAEECYDASGEPIACAGLQLNYRGLLCGEPSRRMQDRGWVGTKYGFVHNTVAGGRAGGVMAAWSQEYGGPLGENQVEDVTRFVLNWETEEMCAFVPVAFPWPDPVELDPNDAWAAWPALTVDDVIASNEIDTAEEIPFEMPLVYPGDAERGREIYVSTYACNSCHGLPEDGPDSAGVGPWHGDLAVNAPNRIAGVSAEAYIYQSMLYPNEYLVEGYAAAMPSYFDQMGESPQDLLDMMTWMLTLDGQ